MRLLRGAAGSHWVDERLDARERDGEHDPRGGDVEAPGVVAQQAALLGRPAEAALGHPAALRHDEARGHEVRGMARSTRGKT
jgi:hypothetical protein